MSIDDLRLSSMLCSAHEAQRELQRPIPERLRAAQAIGDAIMAAGEYRAQRNALAVANAALIEENRRLRYNLGPYDPPANR